MRLSLAALLFASTCLVRVGVAGAQTQFRVRDRLAPDEVSEVTTLYVDGQLVRSFRLDAEQTDITVTVSVPDAPTHDYGLCGQILIRDPDGSERKLVVDITGTIEDAADRDFEAVATNDFTHFYIVDMTSNRTPTEIHPGRARACAPAVS